MARLKSDKITITLRALHKVTIGDTGQTYQAGDIFEYPVEKWDKIVEEAKRTYTIPYFAVPVPLEG